MPSSLHTLLLPSCKTPRGIVSLLRNKRKSFLTAYAEKTLSGVPIAGYIRDGELFLSPFSSQGRTTVASFLTSVKVVWPLQQLRFWQTINFRGFAFNSRNPVIASKQEDTLR